VIEKVEFRGLVHYETSAPRKVVQKMKFMNGSLPSKECRPGKCRSAVAMLGEAMLLRCSTLQRLGFLLAAIAVACASAGAHLLADSLDSSRLHQWEVATRILFWHAVGLWICGTGYPGPGTLMLLSTVLFCGSVFALALGAPSILGAVAPLGGSGMFAAWLWLAWFQKP
jgi:uncharacterized membrane protein YgdD (TMEM256/DUF423 family)